jgi:tRNA (Thr-GGU) A37 N-methylase
VLWWFHQNDKPRIRSTLKGHPRGDPANPLTGVFASRAPMRPNLIALSRCKILSVKKNVIEIDSIDAVPVTPVLDLKPVAERTARASSLRCGSWYDGHT